MKHIILLISITLYVSCNFSSSNKKHKEPLSFSELLEIYEAQDSERKEIFHDKGYMIIPNNDPSGITYSREHKECEADMIWFQNGSKNLDYYLTGNKYIDHYNNIKKEIETKGYLFITTTKDKDNIFREFYFDTINNRNAIIFSKLPVSSTNPCQVENTVIRFNVKPK